MNSKIPLINTHIQKKVFLVWILNILKSNYLVQEDKKNLGPPVKTNDEKIAKPSTAANNIWWHCHGKYAKIISIRKTILDIFKNVFITC